MATEQVIEERVLSIYEAHKELMAEQVFPLYEEKYGETSRSNSIHTTLSRLTKKGLLFVIRRDVSPLTKKTVNVWHIADGTPIPVLAANPDKKTPTQLQGELDVLQLRYKNLEESNAKLYILIEQVRAENQKLQDEMQTYMEEVGDGVEEDI
jgi:hypothetical protein